MKRPIIQHSGVLAASTCIVAGLTFALPEAAIAQADDGIDEEAIEEIIVTGSRIARRPTEEILPTIRIGSDYLDTRGSLNLGEAINENPLFSSSGIGDTDFNQAAVDVGLTFVDLFGLGSERTLTVVDGKRVVSSAAPQPNRGTGSSGLQVDINSIPTALIDRIETVSVGGAPVYGADAIAGTVNVVLRDDFQGLEFDIQGGQTSESDAENVRARLVFGNDLADGRGNIAVAAEYTERSGLLQNARPGSADIQVSNPLLATDPVGFFTADPPLPLNTFQEDTGFPGVSQFGTPAVDLLGFGTAAVFGDIPLGFLEDASGNVLMFDENGELIPVGIGNGNGTFLFSRNQPDFPGLYRQTDFTPMLNDIERTNFLTLGHYDLRDDLRLTMRLNFSQLNAKQPIGSPGVLGTPTQPGLAVSIDNPFINPDARATMQTGFISGSAALLGAQLPFLALGPTFTTGRTLADLSTSGVRADGTNWNGVLGLEGSFVLGQRDFSWDVSFSKGRAESTNSSTAVNASRFALATDVVMIDPGADGQASIGDTILTDSSTFADPRQMNFSSALGAWVDGASGQQIVCRARVDAAAGGPGFSTGDINDCLPYSPFGALNPGAVVDYLTGNSTLFTQIDQQFIQANVTGDLFELPAGPLQFAAGFEYRNEQSSFSTDPLTKAGGFLGTGATTSDVEGEFDSAEVYAEFLVPLIAGDFLRQLDFEAAIRRIDNDIAGADNVWTAGLRAEFAGAFALRGNATRSVRAPSIAELFAGQSPLFSGVADPCSNSQITGGSDPDTRFDNCVADVIASGIAGDQAEAEAFLASYVGAIGGVPGTIGGNTNLDNEEADSWTLGFTWQPPAIERLAIVVDYQDIRIEDAINNLSGSDVVSFCYDSTSYPDAPTCGSFSRAPASFILSGFEAGFINTGFVDFAGLTTTLNYGFELGPGEMDLRATVFRLSRYDTSIDGVDVVDSVELVGREKYRGQFAANYALRDWSFYWQANYVDGAYLDAAARDDDGTTVPLFEFAETSSSLIHNLTVSWAINDQLRLRAIVNNLTEENQPSQLSQFASVQARLGRSYVIGLNATF